MKNTIIFVDVDTQHDFIDQDGALAIPGALEIVPALRRLTRLAEREGIPILATMDTHTPDDPEFSDFPPHCIRHTPGWKKIEATTSDGSACFTKAKLDIFSNPSFAERIHETAPRKAVVYGVATDYCVKYAVLGLCKIIPRVFIVEDAIRPVNPEEGRIAMEEMKAAGAVPITSDRVALMLEEDGC
jgi:nicotinamidase/pyrazinamidase